jgi:hypothetical protein
MNDDRGLVSKHRLTAEFAPHQSMTVIGSEVARREPRKAKIVQILV